jgi:two-component system response regulator NreC
MDIRMPTMDGVEATAKLTSGAIEPAPRVLVLTTFDLDEYVFGALRAGAAGFLLKDAPRERLIEAIRVVHRDEVFLYPSAAKLLLGKYLERSEAGEPAYDGLTQRERDVLRLTAEGYTGQEIAERLVLSPKTVDTYRQRVMEKLNLHHRSELVKYALRKGLLQADAVSEEASA